MNPLVVVVTGASAGVGRAAVRAYGARGARIGLSARGLDGLLGARREVEAAGGEALVLPTDVADATQVEAAAEAVEATFGPIDVWINNAMVSVFSPIMEMSSEEFRRVTEVTYLGYAHGPWPHCVGCDAETAASSCRSDRRLRLAASRCNRRTAALSTPSRAPWTRCSVNCCTKATVLAILANRLASRLVDRYLARMGYEAQQTARTHLAGRERHPLEAGARRPWRARQLRSASARAACSSD